MGFFSIEPKSTANETVQNVTDQRALLTGKGATLGGESGSLTVGQGGRFNEGLDLSGSRGSNRIGSTEGFAIYDLADTNRPNLTVEVLIPTVRACCPEQVRRSFGCSRGHLPADDEAFSREGFSIFPVLVHGSLSEVVEPRREARTFIRQHDLFNRVAARLVSRSPLMSRSSSREERGRESLS